MRIPLLPRPSAQGLVVVLTGASSGIGAAAARRLAADGATVLLLARRADELDAVVADVARAGGSAHAYPVDLTDDEATAATVARLLSEHPRVDVLVNNAARSIRRPVARSTERLHDYERTMAINYTAAVRLTLALLPRFVEQGHGHVVVSSTMSTQVPIPKFSAYLASKSALESFARSLDAELGGIVSTTIVHFPMVRTEMSGATSIYAAMPMMSADQAAGWLVRAVVERPTRVSSLGGTLGEIATAAAPGVVTAVSRPLFRLMDATLARRTRS